MYAVIPFLQLLLDLEDAHDRQMVADATLIDRTLIGAIGFDVAVSGVWFCEEGQVQDACLLVGKGSGVGENMVENRPFALILVSARLEFGSTVDEVMTAREKLELLGVGFSIEITHNEQVRVLSDGSHRIRMCLQLLTDAHTQFLTFAATSFGGQMNHIDIEGVASCDGACDVQNITCLVFLCLGPNGLCFNRMERERRVE